MEKLSFSELKTDLGLVAEHFCLMSFIR